jgi:nitrogenase molybdenum-iron protein beta chain
MFADKKANFEFNRAAEELVQEIRDWTKTPEYKDKNFAREALTVNPAKACQPLGAVFAANGFAKTLPFVHGSQGCVAYYRSHFSRHFKEPTSCVSSSMTEDAAVFGGLNNMVDGLANAYNLYKPEMIAVSTTCMAEVIGDDLNAFIKTAKEKGSVPAEFDVPFAHTPAFVGSHVTGYDNALQGVLQHFWDGKADRRPLVRVPNDSINFIGGFDGFVVGNMKEIKRIFDLFGVEVNILCDPSEVWNTPTDGEFRMYDGGTTKAQVEAALNAKATIVFQEYCCEKTMQVHRQQGPGGRDQLNAPRGRGRHRPLPDGWPPDRQAGARRAGARTRPAGRRHGRQPGPPARQALRALRRPRPDAGLQRVPAGARRRAGPCAGHQRRRGLGEEGAGLFDSSPYGAGCKVYPKRDLWHMRSLLFTEPVDFLIGNTYGKYLERDCGVPLIRLGFPIFDRHHYHRFPTWGYNGALWRADDAARRVLRGAGRQHHRAGKTDYSYDIIR